MQFVPAGTCSWCCAPNFDPAAGKMVDALWQQEIDAEERGYQRVFLKPGEMKTVSIDVQVDRLSYFDVASKNFVVEAGEYEIQIGAASDNIRETKRVRIPEQFVAQFEASR